MSNKKYGFTNIGFIENFTTYLSELKKITGIERIDIQALNENIENAWENRFQEVICLNRKLESTDAEGTDISFLLIDTGLFDFISKEKVYGGFRSNIPTDLTNDSGKWYGVTLGTKEKILSIWENLPFVNGTELDQHTTINTYTGLAAYISRITDCDYTPVDCKKMLNSAFLQAKENGSLENCQNQICYFPVAEISSEATTYYAYSKYNNRYPTASTEWFGLYIETEAELIDRILDLSYSHMGDLLFDSVNDINHFLIDLANKAMKENWQHPMASKEKASVFEYPILKSYLAFTYHHLQDEDALIASEEDKKIKKYNGNAYFNTGLLDRYFRQIFVIGKIDNITLNPHCSNEKYCIQKEVLRNVKFCSENDPQITRIFSKSQLPKLACYFKDRSDVIFDASLDIHFNDEHIFIDGVARKRLPKYSEAYEACKDDPEKISILASRIARDFESACNRAKLLAERNYKLAVPQYWKETGEIQFLLPIYLGEEEEADIPQCALVLSLDHSARNISYRGETILTLDMAYNNARLLAKPDVFWLNDLS